MGVAKHRGTRLLLGRSDRYDRTRPTVEADPVATTRRSIRTVTFSASAEDRAITTEGEIFHDAYLASLKAETRRRLTSADLSPSACSRFRGQRLCRWAGHGWRSLDGEPCSVKTDIKSIRAERQILGIGLPGAVDLPCCQ